MLWVWRGSEKGWYVSGLASVEDRDSLRETKDALSLPTRNKYNYFLFFWWGAWRELNAPLLGKLSTNGL